MPNDLIHIDGSQGEGGGQILRSSLAMSMATGLAFEITRIRAGRAKPGLMRQHLTCLQAAAAICSAQVAGDAIGSGQVRFIPGPLSAGEYHFRIGTAGGTMLVVQAILPALLRAPGPSKVVIEGGTHNKSAPCFEFVERALFPLLRRTGADAQVRLERHGFYPAGGGRVVLEVTPARKAKAVEILTRGERLGAHAFAVVSRLPLSIAHRELEVLCQRLSIDPAQTQALAVGNPVGPGNAAGVELRYEHITEVFSGVGEVAKSAEEVAREVSDEARAYIAAQRPVGEHLADQLMVPLALLAGGRFATTALTPHSLTNMQVIRAFGGCVEEESGGMVRVAARFPTSTPPGQHLAT